MIGSNCGELIFIKYCCSVSMRTVSTLKLEIVLTIALDKENVLLKQFIDISNLFSLNIFQGVKINFFFNDFLLLSRGCCNIWKVCRCQHCLVTGCRVCQIGQISLFNNKVVSGHNINLVLIIVLTPSITHCCPVLSKFWIIMSSSVF